MSYIIPNGYRRRYVVKAQQFITQHGHEAVEFVGEEVPDTYKDGFKYYDDNDHLLADYSKYEHPYKPNAYSVVRDDIDYPKPASDPTPMYSAPYDPIYDQVNELTEKVNELTPYTETKTAYIDETSITFETERQGNILIDAISRSGESVLTVNKRDGNTITVLFDPLEEVTDITLTIQ